MAGGRPSKFKPEFVEQAQKLAQKGWTDPEIAEFFGVAESTLYLWKHEHPGFSEALTLGKDEPDNRVQHSLYRRALGYSHPDVHVSTYEGKVTLTKITRHYPPDTTAALAWLNNRRPDIWRQRREEAPADAAAAAAAIRDLLKALDTDAPA